MQDFKELQHTFPLALHRFITRAGKASLLLPARAVWACATWTKRCNVRPPITQRYDKM